MMYNRYFCSGRNYFIGIAALLLVQFTTGGTTTSTSSPNTTYSNSTGSIMTSSTTTPISLATTFSNMTTSPVTTSGLLSSLTTTTASPTTTHISTTTTDTTTDSTTTASPITTHISTTTTDNTTFSTMKTSSVTTSGPLTSTLTTTTAIPTTTHISTTTTDTTTDSTTKASPITTHISTTTTDTTTDSTTTASPTTTHIGTTTTDTTTFSTTTASSATSDINTITSDSTTDSTMTTSPTTTHLSTTTTDRMTNSTMTTIPSNTHSSTTTTNITTDSTLTPSPVITSDPRTPTSVYTSTATPVTSHKISTTASTVYTSTTTVPISIETSEITSSSSTTTYPATTEDATIDCGPPKNITNGHVNYTNTTFNETVTYTCDIGYRLIGNNTNTCDESGGWVGGLPECRLVECPQPTDISNGTIHYTNTTYNATVAYTCNIGYILDGNNTNICDERGSWIGDIPECMIVDCGDPSVLRNGSIYYTNTTFNETVTYTCDIGHILIGNNTNTCDENSTWVGDPPICQIVDCGYPRNITNGTKHYTSTIFNAPVKYSCDVGYNFNGNNTNICDENGIWVGDVPICQIVDCGPPNNITNGDVYYTNTTFNETVTYTCDIGYRLIRNNTNTCGESGRWVGGFPECRIVDCGYPRNITNGTKHYTNTTFNAPVRYSCDVGYRFIGNNTNICDDNGTWVGDLPICQIVDCRYPRNITNGAIYYTSTTFNAPVRYSCDVGYRFIGNNTNICDKSGIWVGDSPTCKIVDCGHPESIANGTVYYTNTAVNEIATYTCATGYRLIGDNNPVCGLNGSWVGDIPECTIVEHLTSPPTGEYNGSTGRNRWSIKHKWNCDNECLTLPLYSDCGNPMPILQGNVSFTDTLLDSLAMYTCNLAYNLVGNNTIQCGEDGLWIETNASACHLVDCGLPWNITNGQYTLYGTTYSSVALYRCEDGYKLNNTHGTAVCNASGTWHGEISTCVKVECEGPSQPKDGNFSYSDGKRTVTFACDPNYRLIGQDKLFCRSTGNWSEAVPKCEKVGAKTKYCPKDQDSREKWWDRTPQEQIVTLTCPENQEGSISRQCTKDGVWKLPRYACVKKEISEAESQIDSIGSDFTDAAKKEIVSNVLGTLSKSTNSTASTTSSSSPASSGMGDGEIEKVTSILEKVASISQNINVSEKQSEDFIGTTSNLLNPQNSGSFRSLEDNKDQAGTSTVGAAKVLAVVGNFTKAIAKGLNKVNSSKTIKTDNMVVTVARIDKGEDIQFPLKGSTSPDSKKSASAGIPTFQGNGTYSGILYRNLSGLLSSQIHDEGSADEGDFEINGAVLDMQLSNPTTEKFKINLNFDNFQSGTFESKCCFWNFSRSSWDTFGCKLDTNKTNDSLTVCTCNHTTNFAILMNPYNTKNVDSKVLDYITLVCCSISMVCLIVTVVMHAALWRYLKSDRAKILINLSIALILSYATFIFGTDKTENKIACKTVAVALHYIYLVVFFLMLAEGIEIFITVVYVFVMKSRLRWLILMSWGAPMIIVAISVASTQSDGYGSEDYCWLSVGSGLIWAFVGPALAIIIANFVLLGVVIKAMFRVQSLKEKSRIEKVKTGVRCLCVLLPLTGGTWVIGVFYFDESMAWVQYVFAVLNGFQGVFIMLFHCLTNSQIRIAVSRRMKLYRASTSYSRSSDKTMSIPRPSTTTSLRHEHSTGSYNDSYDLIDDSYQLSNRYNFRGKEASMGYTTSFW